MVVAAVGFGFEAVEGVAVRELAGGVDEFAGGGGGPFAGTVEVVCDWGGGGVKHGVEGDVGGGHFFVERGVGHG